MYKIKVGKSVDGKMLEYLKDVFFMKDSENDPHTISRIFMDIAEAEAAISLLIKEGYTEFKHFTKSEREFIRGDSCDIDGRSEFFGCDVCRWRHKCLRECDVDVVKVMEIIDENEVGGEFPGWLCTYWRPFNDEKNILKGRVAKEYKVPYNKVGEIKGETFVVYKTEALIHTSKLYGVVGEIDSSDHKVMILEDGDRLYNFNRSSTRFLMDFKKYPHSGNKIKQEETKMTNARMVTRKGLTADMVDTLVGKGAGVIESYGSHDGFLVLLTTEAIEGTRPVVKVDGVWTTAGNEAEVAVLKKYGKIGLYAALVVDGNIASWSAKYTGDAKDLKEAFGIKEEVTSRILRDLREMDQKRIEMIVEIKDKIDDINEKFDGFEPDSGLEVYKKVAIVGRKTTTGCEDPVPPIERGVVFVVDEDGAKVFIGEWQNGDRADEADLKDFNNKKLVTMRNGIDGALEEVAESVASFKRQLNK